MTSDWHKFLAFLRERMINAFKLEQLRKTDGPDASEYEILQRLDLVVSERPGIDRDAFKLRSFDNSLDPDTGEHDSLDPNTDDIVERGVLWASLYQAAYSIDSPFPIVKVKELGLELLIDSMRRGPVAGYMALLQYGLGHGRSFDLTTIMIASFDCKARAALKYMSMRRGLELLELVHRVPIAVYDLPKRFGQPACEIAITLLPHLRRAARKDDPMFLAYEAAEKKVYVSLYETERGLVAHLAKASELLHYCRAMRARPW